MAAGRVTDRDRGYNRIRRMFRLGSRRRAADVLVGLRGDGPAGDQHGADDDLTVAEIGSLHEFGAEDLPERSFIRAPFDDNVNDYGVLATRLSGQMVDGSKTHRQALELLGEAARSDQVEAINRGIPPRLKDATIARKGSSKQLIETAQMKQSLDFVVRL